MARRGVEFSLLGLSELKVSLDTLREDIKANLVDALDDTAHAIQFKARVNVPRDKGDLARAIQIAGKGLNIKVGLSDEAVSSRGGRNSAHLHPWIYGLWIEHGLNSRNIEAHPFMGPAVDSEEALHNARVERALDGALTSVT